MRANEVSKWFRLVAMTLLSCNLGLAACQPDFEPKSKLSTLRVLGVQADHPYPHPGQDVHLKILWHDGKAPVGEPRPVQVLWMAGCYNPKGDMYYGCYPQLAKRLAAGGQSNEQVPEGLVGMGNEFTYHVPDDLLQGRPSPASGPPYGLSFVFFAACAGRIGPLPAPSQAEGLPLGCFDAQGNMLGPDDFVPGYLALYSYEKRTNTNPIVGELTLDGEPMSDSAPLHVPACRGDCASLPLSVTVDPSSVERNEGYENADGSPQFETIWVEYFTTDGSLDKATRLVSNARGEFRENHAAQFQPPSEPGVVELYAVVRDNRGGTAWAKGRVIVE